MKKIEEWGFDDGSASRLSEHPPSATIPPDSKERLRQRLGRQPNESEWKSYVAAWHVGFGTKLESEQNDLIGYLEIWTGDTDLRIRLLSFGFVRIIPRGHDFDDGDAPGLALLRDGTLCVTETMVDMFKAEPRAGHTRGRFRWKIPEAVMHGWPGGLERLTADLCDFISRTNSGVRLKSPYARLDDASEGELMSADKSR